nr:MAG TPA: crystallin beta/gamma motif-containing protein [Caudoviricetes sp.]
MAPLKIFTNQNTMHYNGDIQMADINQQERDEFQALIRGYGQGPRSFTANAGVQSDPVGGLTPVGQAIGKGIDTVSDIAKSTTDALSTIANTPISVTNDDGTTTVSPFGQQGNTFQAIGQLGQSLPNALPASFVSNTDRLFLYNNDQLRANEALRIAKTLNIGADTVMFGDDKAFERADYLSRRAERGQVLQDIYDEFPELYKVKYGSQAEGIQALNNIESIKNTKGIFDSLQQSIWAMNDQMKLGDVGFALAYESDPQKISELTAEVNRLQNNLQNYRRPDGGSPLQEVLGSTASQIYMMGKQGGTGAVVGGIIGGIGGGVVSGGSAAIPTAMTGAKWLGSADMAYEMYKMSFGNKYLELIGKRDQKGNRVYSNEEAKEYAMSFAAIDAGIEFVATRAIGKAASKIAPKSALANAVSRGTTTAAETFNRGIGVTAAQVAKTSIKAGAPELFEEGLQDVNEKLQHNLWRKSNDQEGPYSAGDMFVGAGEAMWQALPAVVGFGAIGGGISGVRTMKAFKDFQKLSPEEQHMAVMEEQNRNGHVIMQNLKNDAAVNNLAKENPELYGKIVQAQGDNIGVSTAYVNVNEMAETAEGQTAIRNMVDAGLVTQEDVSKAITADAPIEIPIGSYAQLSGGLSEETVKALEESSYFTRGGLSMKTLERAKEEVHAMKDLVKDDNEKRAERVKNDIIRSYFDETSDVDKEMLDIVLADPTHIKQTFNNVYKELTEQYREQYTSDFDAMDTDLETARTSGVNPTWLGESKPPRSNSERRRMAYQSSLARTQNALADNPEALNQAGAHYADMEHMLKQIESLESMRDKLFELADNDIALRMQLSKSGYEVYQSLKSIMSNETVDRKQRDTAEANALLMAQHADVMADIMRRAGRGNYTAMDYFNTVRVQMNGGAYNNGYAQPLQMQQKIETAIKNWGQVVEDQLSGKQINRTVQIMDSPLVLQMLGFDGAVMIDPSIIHKVITGKHANQISIDDIKLLPKKIANPVAVFKNYNGRSQKAVPDEAILVLDMYAKNGNPNINASGENIQVVVTFTKTANGTNINKIKTITPRRNINWYNQQIANGNLLYANTKKINRLVTGSRQQMAQPVTKQFIVNNSIPNENDLDKLRKQHNYQYYQAAWHGSPHDFDEFDLGKIGTGEGAQAHGWGLYFAKKKSVSKNYQKVLSKRLGTTNPKLFKVEIPDEKTMLDEDKYFKEQNKDVINKIVSAVNDLDIDKRKALLEYYKTHPSYPVNKEYEKILGKIQEIKHEKEYITDALLNNVNKIKEKIARETAAEYGYNFDELKADSTFEMSKKLLGEMDEKLSTLKKEKEVEGAKEKIKEDKILESIGDTFTKTPYTGRDVYVALSKAFDGDKGASEFLNSTGVKGITYDGYTDGRCYVVFDDKAIKVIEKYNQSINGMTTINSPTDRLIQIFKTADRSTFLHEMGHVFFDDIKNLAEMENAPEQLVMDWNKLKEWSEWDDAQGADNTKAHEKFARGWEAYLREGNAPTKGLQRVFRMFSKWLTRIYRAVTRLGGLPPKEIQDIMARMIATQEDIDAYTKEQALEQFESSKLFKQLDEAEQAKVQGYIADVGEMAKERVMKRYMKELESRPIKEWNDEKDSIQADIEKRLMEQYPIYKDHQRYNAFGKNALANTRYDTLKELEAAEREQTGFTFNEAVNQAMESAEQTFIEDNHIGKSNIEIAEEWLLSSDGQMKLTEEEAKIIKSQTNRDLAKNWELLDRLNRLNPNSETIESELEIIEKELTKEQKLRKEKAKVDKELGSVSKELDKANDEIERLKEQQKELQEQASKNQAELKDEKNELSKRLTIVTNRLDRIIEQKERLEERMLMRLDNQSLSSQERIEQLKDLLQDRINNVRAIRDSGVGVINNYMNRARQELGDLTLSQASQYKKYQNQAIREGKRADKALAVNKLEEALQAKQLQLLNQARARVAFDNALQIKKLRTKLLDNLNRMTRPKNPITIEPNMRYFYTHMAYQMGLTKYDGLEPVDGFDMNAVINALDPDADILGDQSITFLDPWIVQLFYGKTPMSFKNLTMSQLNTLEELMTGMYKNGRNAYEGSTILNDKGESITFDDAVDDILTEAIDTFGKVNGNVFNAQNNQTGLEAVAGLINKGNLSLLKVETFLRRLGPDAVKYIYDPISRATQAFNERKEVSMRRLAKDVSSVYGKRELFNIRNKHMYDVGELRNLTKEQVIALALNWGTERNRQRAMETAKVTEVEMEKAFQEILTDKDWEFIIRTWDHINSFFTERSKVQEELYGNPLKKEEGITFTIGGRTIVGQYYPIVYNPEVNASISDKEVEDIAKTMVSSNAILGTGMSATKSRLDVVKDKSLLLDFDVIPNSIIEAINHVTMRKAVTDVNRLVANREFQNYIVEKFGINSYQFLRTWVRDNWKDEAAKLDAFGKIVTALKRNTSMAIMAGRVSVAIQNTLNIPVAVYRIGAGNVLQAINHAGVGFYGHGTELYNNTRDFVLEQSIFMRERIQTLDKDLKKGLAIQGKGLRINDKNIGGYKFEKGAEIRDEINNMGFRLLTETDFALSIPVWKFAYDQKVAELQSKEGLSTEWINQQAIEAGDRAIRDIFGSGDTKDAAAIQRARNPLTQLFVPFYSYANTLYNIIAEGWYAGKDKGDWTQFARMLWWTVVSQAIGMVIYKSMTNGDDDDPESIAKSFAEEFVQQGTMGIPLVRDISNMGMKFILGERPYNKGNTVMGLSIFEKLWDTGQAISSDNKDFVDVGRSLSQVSNRITGFSDTVTDAFWTLLRVGVTDTDAKIEDVFMSILLDKRLKTKKEKKKKQ